MSTLVPTQHLARLKTSNDLQDEIAKLRQKQHVMTELLKPWTTSALPLTHDIDGATKRLNQFLASITMATNDPPSQKMVTLA